MGRYRTINVDLNRQYRNDLNQNFTDIERDITEAELEIARVDAESKERDNLLAGTDVQAIINRIDTSATNAELQSVYAKNQGDYAKTQGDHAKTQGDYALAKGNYADEKAIAADTAAANANTEASNLSQLKIDVTTATQNANTATTNANNAATYATTQGDYAKQEADRIAGMDVGELSSKIGDLTTLQTENKSSLVNAINEVETQVTNHESRLNQLENGSVSVKADVSGLNREVAYLKLKQDASERIEGGTVFADDMNGNRFGFTLDEVNSSGFKIRNGKMVLLKDETISHSVTDKTLVSSAYSTVGNGGRKLVCLGNGYLFVVLRDGLNTRIYKSIDNGENWSSFFSTTSPNSLTDVTLTAVDSTTLGLLFAGNNYISFKSFDAESGTEKVSKSIEQQTAIGNIALENDPTNGRLHAVWVSKNSTRPNAFNIRYSKSTDGGVTWSTADTVTDDNNSLFNWNNPTLVIFNGLPRIIATFNGSDVNSVFVKRHDGANWINGQITIYAGASHVQSNPSTVIDKDGVISSVWHGRDATHTTVDYIRFSKSLDGGDNWSTMKKLVQGKNATLTVDKNNKYIITYEEVGIIKRIESIDKGESWSTPTIVGNGTNPSVLFDDTFTLGFTTPPTIYMSASNVKFTGNWTGLAEVPSTTATAIYNIPSTDYVGTFVQKEGNITITAYLNDELMDSELEGNEYQFVHSLTTESPATLRFELIRADTSNGENDAVTRILGGRS